MKHSNMKLVGLAIMSAVSGISVSACAGQNNIAGFDPAKEITTPAAKVVFNKINPAISMGGAYGDKSKGGHGTFGKFPANFITPFHTHSGAYHGVVISGTMTNPFKGEQNPPELKAGSYWYVPDNAEHATACVSEEPCLFYFHANRAFDFHPTK
ncbi:MAG: DUF4437 domain-containing protein [Alphaproteobacteria bacterium]|nr:DUF4437 domain-containing protein [Alphaproteobacteria bacterium]